MLSFVFIVFIFLFDTTGALHIPSQSGITARNHAAQSVQQSVRQRASQAVSFISASALVLINYRPQPARATVFFDRAVYGDKELKIAVVNKIKQNLRNSILQDTSLAPEYLQLALTDALGYNAVTGDGGLDGSVEFELDKLENQGLFKAAKAIQDVKSSLKRTTQVTYGDLVAFAGAEALESVGCNRITVQVGRYEVKAANPSLFVVDWKNPDISAVKSGFLRAGLTSRDIVVLIGSLGEINRIVTESLQTKRTDDDDDEPFEPQPFVPSTFGARDEIYGKKIGNGDFGGKYFASLLKSKSPDGLGRLLLDDPGMKALVQKYATSDSAFKQDVADTYTKLNLLGESYTNRNAR